MLEVGMAHDDCDVLCSSFHSLAQHVYDSFHLVLASRKVSEKWILRFQGLLDARSVVRGLMRGSTWMGRCSPDAKYP